MRFSTLGSCQCGMKMPCRACKSENLQKFDGELTASLPDPKGVGVPPVYTCQSVLICLDCGFAELVVPTSELHSLKRGKAALDS
jgi:hypothetical protein